MHLNGEAYLPGAEASGKTVRIDAPAPGVRLLTLDRPDRLNAMSGELIRDLISQATSGGSPSWPRAGRRACLALPSTGRSRWPCGRAGPSLLANLS
jgi:hypothetical protein